MRNNCSCYRPGRHKLFLGKYPRPPSQAWSILKQPELAKSQAAQGNKMVSWTPGYKIAWRSFPTRQVGTRQSLKNMSQGLISRCGAVRGFPAAALICIGNKQTNSESCIIIRLSELAWTLCGLILALVFGAGWAGDPISWCCARPPYGGHSRHAQPDDIG